MADIPLPRVVADVGPGGGIPSAINALNVLDKQQLENQYYGPTAEANALSKAAYAKYAGPQAIAAFLQSPMASNLTQDQYNGLVKEFQHGITNPRNINVSPRGGGMSGNILRLLLGKMFGQGDQQQESLNALNQQQPGMQQSNQNPMAQMGMQPQEMGMPPEQGMIAPGGRPASTIDRIAQQGLTPGTMGGNNPSAISKAQEQRLATLATSEATSQNKLWEEIHKESASNAIGAQNNLNLLDKFDDAYDQLKWLEKGPGFGSVMGLSTAAQNADIAANGLANSVARAEQSGHITGRDRDTYSSMKPGRHMNDQARKDQVAFIRGMNERMGQEPAFYTKAQELGLNPQQAKSVWTNFIKEKPFYDAKQHKVLDKNIDAWEEYLTPKKISESLNPSQRKKKEMNNEEKPTGKKTPEKYGGVLTVSDGDKKYIHINGRWMTV